MMSCDNCKDAPGFYCPICAPPTPTKPAICGTCHDATCPCGKVAFRTEAELVAALRVCRAILAGKLARAVERVKALKQGHSPECTSTREDMGSVLCICGGSRYLHNRAIDAAVADINDKETP